MHGIERGDDRHVDLKDGVEALYAAHVESREAQHRQDDLRERVDERIDRVRASRLDPGVLHHAGKDENEKDHRPDKK